MLGMNREGAQDNGTLLSGEGERKCYDFEDIVFITDR